MKLKSKATRNRWKALAVAPVVALCATAIAPVAHAAARPGVVPKAIVKVAPPTQLVVAGVYCVGVSPR